MPDPQHWSAGDFLSTCMILCVFGSSFDIDTIGTILIESRFISYQEVGGVNLYIFLFISPEIRTQINYEEKGEFKTGAGCSHPIGWWYSRNQCCGARAEYTTLNCPSGAGAEITNCGSGSRSFIFTTDLKNRYR
jgi:hypothetical protein